MIKILLFDFDGTIADTFKLGCDSLAFVLRQNHLAYDNRVKELLGYRISEVLRMMHIGSKFFGIIRKEFYNLIMKSVNDLRPCIDLKLLGDLSKDYGMIIVSNSETSYLKKGINVLKIDKIFREFYGSNNFKSKEAMLKRIFKKYHVKPKECVYVGDRPSDIDSARIAKCWSVGIHNGCSWSTLKQMKEANPDFIVKNFDGLKGVLKKIK